MLRDAGFFEKRGFVVEIEATPRCNLACPFYDHRPGGEASGPDRPEVDLDALSRPVLCRDRCTYEFRR